MSNHRWIYQNLINNKQMEKANIRFNYKVQHKIQGSGIGHQMECVVRAYPDATQTIIQVGPYFTMEHAHEDLTYINDTMKKVHNKD